MLSFRAESPWRLIEKAWREKLGHAIFSGRKSMKIDSRIKENLALGYPLSRKKTLHHLESVFLGLWTPLGSDLGGNLGPKMEPQIHKNLLKSTFEKFHKNTRPQNTIFLKFETIWDGFREGRAWRNRAFRPIHPSKSWKSCDVTSHPKKISSKIDFRVIWAPSWAPKSSQNRDKKSLEKWWKHDDDDDDDDDDDKEEDLDATLPENFRNINYHKKNQNYLDIDERLAELEKNIQPKTPNHFGVKTHNVRANPNHFGVKT